MKGFLFLLFTISLLVTTQIQTGVLGSNVTAAAVPGVTVKPGSPRATPGIYNHPGAPGGAGSPSRPSATTRTPASTKSSPRKPKGTAPALSSPGGAGVLLVLTNTLVHLFCLS